MNKFELLELIENIKEKITDNEYKLIVEKLGTINTKKFQFLAHIKQQFITSNYDESAEDFIIKVEERLVESKVYETDLECRCKRPEIICVCCKLKICKKMQNIVANDQLILNEDLQKYVEELYSNETYEVSLNSARLRDIFTIESLFEPTVSVDVVLL